MSFIKSIKSLKEKRFLFSLLMGFSSGLPFLLTSTTLKYWLKSEGLDLKTIGYAGLIGLPYTLKFLTAPLLDHYTISNLGRRRGWLIVTQLGLIVSLLTLSFIQPNTNILLFCLIAFGVAFFSANQDTLIDAYRRETLSDDELGLGTALYTYGYRIAMLISGGLALILADHINWSHVYQLMSLISLLTLLITLKSEEPKITTKSPSLYEAVIDPFKDFLKREAALIILLFFILFKVGDNLAGAMLPPFYREMGFSQTTIGIIAKTLSPYVTLIGPAIGGFLVMRLGIFKALWISGIMQSLSTFGFAVLSWVGNNIYLFGSVVIFEDLTASIGSIAFVSYMASLCNKRFTATQYALLSSLTGVPRVLIATPSGAIAEKMGWSNYFTACALAAIPGLLLLLYIRYRYDGNLAKDPIKQSS